MARIRDIGMEDYVVDVDTINSEWPKGPDAAENHTAKPVEQTDESDELQQEKETNQELGTPPTEVEKAAAEISPEITEVVDEVQEVTPGMDEIGELTESLESAQNLMERIKTAGGMNLKFGLEAHRLFPADFNVPLSQFTSKLSPVRYTASIESLDAITKKIKVSIKKVKK